MFTVFIRDWYIRIQSILFFQKKKGIQSISKFSILNSNVREPNDIIWNSLYKEVDENRSEIRIYFLYLKFDIKKIRNEYELIHICKITY